MVTLEDLMKHETKFARTIQWRNVREYVAAAVVISVFTALAFGPHGPRALRLTARVGCLLIVAATIFVAARLRSRGTPSPAPAADATTRDHLAHYRAELIRQRDLLASVPRWYLAPFLPGMALFFAGVALDRVADGASTATVAARMVFPLFSTKGIYALIGFANHVVAKKLARVVDALDD